MLFTHFIFVQFFIHFFFVFCNNETFFLTEGSKYHVFISEFKVSFRMDGSIIFYKTF